ncbi:MAG: ribosome recycling factor [Veillonella sp.]|nr:ribosome recycling factor [Veillonella sp.]
MEIKELLQQAEDRMNKSIEALKHEFASIRTGRAILQSDLGLNPGNDGAQIRLSIPQLTEERRKEIVKVVHKKAEDAKVAVRNIRRDVNEALKKEEKAKTITEDDAKDGLDQIQKLTDAKVKQIDELKVVKEKDVLEV